MKSYMADKANRTKASGLPVQQKSSMMDFTDIKYSTTSTVAAKPPLKNSSSMDSSETVHSPNGHYDDDEFDSSTTQGTNELNSHSDTVDSVDDLTVIGDYNFDKYPSYSDQRNVESNDAKHGNDVVHDIEKLRKISQDEITENESYLDQFCESLSRDVKIASKDGKKEARSSAEKVRFPLRSSAKCKEAVPKKLRTGSGTNKKKSLDPTKKTELLAQLKAIDKNE